LRVSSSLAENSSGWGCIRYLLLSCRETVHVYHTCGTNPKDIVVQKHTMTLSSYCSAIFVVDASPPVARQLQHTRSIYVQEETKMPSFFNFCCGEGEEEQKYGAYVIPVRTFAKIRVLRQWPPAEKGA